MQHMKIKLGRIVWLLSLAAIVYLVFFRNHSTEYQELMVTDVQMQELLKDRKDQTTSEIQLALDEQNLFLDQTTKTFFYSVPENYSQNFDGSDDWIHSLPITWNCTRWGSLGQQSLQLAVNGCDFSLSDICENRVASLLFYTDTEYAVYYLCCTTLPLLNLSSQQTIGDEAVRMSMTLYDNRVGSAAKTIWSEGTIHVRGGSTRAFPKKGYRLSLTAQSPGEHTRKNHISLLGMRQDDDWILYPAYNDQEKIRNVFSSNLWQTSCAADNAVGANTGMEYRYLELFMNGSYWGLYALGYPIDEKQFCTGHEQVPCDIFKKKNWNTEIENYEIVSSAHEHSRLSEYFQRLDQNPDNVQMLYQGIDLDNSIDLYLFLNLVQGLDHISKDRIKNLYIAINGDLQAVYAPWDLDITWGNKYNGDAANLTEAYGISTDKNRAWKQGYLARLIELQDAGIRERIREKYETLRSTFWSEEALMLQLDEYEKQIFDSGAYVREQQCWPEGSYEDPELKLELFRKYVKERLQQMDQYILEKR